MWRPLWSKLKIKQTNGSRTSHHGNSMPTLGTFAWAIKHYIYTYIQFLHTYIHTYIHTRNQNYVHTCVQNHTYELKWPAHTRHWSGPLHNHMHARIHTCIHICIHTYTHTYELIEVAHLLIMHAHIHTYIHAYTYAYIHTHTHMSSLKLPTS